jgi:hypothetical protein
LRLTLAAFVISLLVAAPAGAQELRVVVVPGLELRDLDGLAAGGAVGLLVPGAGPETSRRQALAQLVRGKVENSLRGGIPEGAPLIDVDIGPLPARGPAIVLALPAGGEQDNDRRYPIAVVGSSLSGLLTSESTRIPGLVSIADVAPTALAQPDGLDARATHDPPGDLRELDRRIRDNGSARTWGSLLAALLLAGLVLVSGRAALLGFAAVLTANLLLGLAEASALWAVLPTFTLGVVVAVIGSRGLSSNAAIGLVLALVVAAYLVVLAVDPDAVALSPLGPTQNARFYGLSNLLATLLLVPALAGAALVARRFGPVGFVAVAVIAVVTVAASRFGADGGGAVVLAVGLLVLAAGMWRLRGRALAAIVVAGTASVALALAVGPDSHVTRAIGDGPTEVAEDLAERVELSIRRSTAHPATAIVVAAGLVGLVLLARATIRLDARRRALPAALLVAIATSLVVNDSPLEVTLAGLIALAALVRFARAAEPA